ncbi:DUF4265 domain-containing protein [Streptomyces sp. CB03238]|uniref:DUF4265 domain-containing protein n=1 Tax=Streptomyces sp. CB03238 TaxID=1907777 RepID=UPI0015C47E7A|nr:DUF4265 domain-containing protein [Streptomyces sp. CB03238]
MKIAFRLDPEIAEQTGVHVESVWGADTSAPDTYRLCSIPFLVTGVSLGDEVRAERSDDRLWFSRKVKDAGNSTVAIWTEDAELVETVRDELRRIGCESELWRQRMVSANVPAHVSIGDVWEVLNKYSEDRLTYWERSISAVHEEE